VPRATKTESAWRKQSIGFVMWPAPIHGAGERSGEMKWYKFNRAAPDIEPARLDAVWQEFADRYGDPHNDAWKDGGVGLWHYNLLDHGIIRQVGYQFDLRDVLTKWLVQDEQGDIRIAYAPSKTALRNGGSWQNKAAIKIAPCPPNFA
jgi:hypothetical protein